MIFTKVGELGLSVSDTKQGRGGEKQCHMIGTNWEAKRMAHIIKVSVATCGTVL